MHVVRRLGRAPQGELAVGRPVGDRGVLLHRQVGAPLEEEQVLAHQVGCREAFRHVAELQVDELVEVAAVAVVVDARLGVRDRVRGVGDGAERLVGHVDQIERRGRGLFAHRRDGGDGIAHEAHLVGRQRVLVLAHGEDAEGDRQVLPGEHGLHAREGLGSRRIDAGDQGVGVGTAEQLGVQHAGEEQVVGESRSAGDLGGRVDLAERFADDSKLPVGPPGRRQLLNRRLLTGRHTGSPVPASRPRPACEPQLIPPPRRS